MPQLARDDCTVMGLADEHCNGNKMNFCEKDAMAGVDTTRNGVEIE